jgi:hypothetical protein
MRPWVIVLSSAIAAIVVAAALAVPEVINAPRSEIASTLLPHLLALAVAALAAYGLCAMLLTTANLVAGTLRVRTHLARPAPDRVPARRDWLAAFGTNGLRQLARRLVPALARSGREDGVFAIQTRSAANETRSEIARLYYISLARSHFLSALIVLAGIAGLGLAQDHGSLPFQHEIPTGSALLITIGLVLLAVLGRIAVDVTAEPLLETIAQLPAERVEIGLLRRAVELLELACNGTAAEAPAVAQLPERLVTAIEQGQHALLDAVGQLSANTQALETTIRTSAAQQRPVDGDKVAEVTAFPELQAAVEELTAVLRRLGAVSENAQETALDIDPLLPPRGSPAPRLARELRRLLQEIDAAR